MFAPVNFLQGFGDLISYVSNWCTNDTTKVRNVYKGEPIKLTKRENMTLDALWCTAKSENGPTAILFHGESDTVDAMLNHAKWYYDRGINTMVVSISGYPGSGGDTANTGELGLYIDVETAIHYVTSTKKVPKEQIIAHGYSLGGALAAAAGQFFGTYVTLDHPIDTIEKTFPSGSKYATNGVTFVTDGLNTLAKMEKCTKDLFIFCGPNDRHTDNLYEAKYGTAPSEAGLEERENYVQSKNNHTAILPDHHQSVFIKYTDASDKYANYLYSIGLMNSNYL